MYKSIGDTFFQNKALQHLAILPGFSYSNEPVKIRHEINNHNKFSKDKNVISDKIFVKFFNFIDHTNNNSTRKKKLSKNYSKKNRK